MRFRAQLGLLALAGSATFLVPASLASTASAAPADEPPPLEETYDYPGAAKIFAERGILLKKGDGHILLTSCSPSGDFLEVRSRNRDSFCFRVTGATGYLTLELTDTFLILGDSRHTTVANYSVDGQSGTKTVAPGGAEGIGEGAGQHTATLLEIRVTS